MSDYMDEQDTKISLLNLSDVVESDAEFLPIFSGDKDEANFNNEEIPESLPILPLRNTVLFPGVVIPITVGRASSIKLIQEANQGSKIIGVVTQKDPEVENPTFDDIYHVGTMARVVKMLQMPDGNTTVIIQGRRTIQLEGIVSKDPYFVALIKVIDSTKPIPKTKAFQALITSLRDLTMQVAKKTSNSASDVSFAIRNIESPPLLVSFIASNLDAPVETRQKLLENLDIKSKAKEVLTLLSKELQMAELKHDIQSKVKVELDKQQRDYLLHQQIRTIQEELGDNPVGQFVEELRERAKDKKWSDNISEVFNKELMKLQRMNPAAAEYSIQTNYLETIVDLPWDECTEDNLDLNVAQKILDRDHFGLEKVKERIIEYMAVLKLKKDMKSPILCLVGPPGVGKTSLGKSLADAVGRKYIRMSLGGLRDEAEIRGHRKTYIGAMPGRIIQSLKKCKSSNPVFVLDEVDKVAGANASGDPSAALLELLDPEQNSAFYDNFLELDYDLSKVMFVATANTTQSIHPALLDRMEIIDISGYLLEEKLEIARRHLIPKQLKEHGIKASQLQFPKATLTAIIEGYTRESGVRKLEKNIAKMIRSNARFIASDEEYVSKLRKVEVEKFLGAPKVQKEVLASNEIAGVVTGLAWTSVGGVILHVEASMSEGEGKFTQTGQLGSVMKESATIAYEYLKSHAAEYDIPYEIFKKWNVHFHVPEGATPKDGPSAGVTILTALTSLFTQQKVTKGIAMTGEITLRGKVLPVGGIKEKILAAKRVGIKTLVLPEANRKDVLEIQDRYIKGLSFHYMKEMSELLDFTLSGEKVKSPKELNYKVNAVK